MALYGVALATLADDPGLCPEANAFVAGLSRPNGSERRRFANRAEVLEGPFERCIQQFETEIDFGISRRQWRGLLLGIEFEALDRGQRHSAPALSDAVTDNAMHLGLCANIVRTGASDGVMRIAPPLTATDAEIDLGLELLDAALERTLENLRPVREAPALATVRAG